VGGVGVGGVGVGSVNIGGDIKNNREFIVN
jgi:hypothetical protein